MQEKNFFVLTYPKIIAIAIILFPLFNCFIDVSKIGYYDEIIGAISIFIIFKYKLENYLEKCDKWILYGMILITLIGIISNISSKLISNIFAISVDILWLWKTFATFLAFKYISARNNRVIKVLQILCPLAKIAIVFVCASALIGQFIDIGVTGKTVIGPIKAFYFFWQNGIQTGWLLFCCMLVIVGYERNKKIIRMYFVFTLIPLILTFSSLVLCWCFITVSVLFFVRENKKIKVRSIILIVAGVVALNAADVSTYLLGGHVRGTLIKYGIVTAITYFPFGSGFATYGSEMAKRYYSQLYIKYGWANTWAFGKDSNYLNDNFFASIVGQFGFIGFAIYLTVLCALFVQINSKSLDKYERVFSIATVLTIIAVMIGSASAKSIMGICTFAVLGIISSKRLVVQNV